MPNDEKVRALVSGAQRMRESKFISADDFVKIVAYAMSLEVSSRIQPKIQRQNDLMIQLSERLNARLNTAELSK